MDYSKSGGPKAGRKNAPGHAEHNAKGSRKNPFGDDGTDKAALLARMKAAARKDRPEQG
ncbi:hypothetical protein [Paenirhodobacter sp.]|uniref:hypothetical protein n=1 Tax=Paenirhodobacter sp. TaxID=1965326 RepID=UPI003B424BCB